MFSLPRLPRRLVLGHELFDRAKKTGNATARTHPLTGVRVRVRPLVWGMSDGRRPRPRRGGAVTYTYFFFAIYKFRDCAAAATPPRSHSWNSCMAAAAAENGLNDAIIDLVLLRWDENIRIVKYDMRLRQMRWCPSNDDGDVYAVARQRTRAADEPRRGAVQCSGAVQRVPPRGWGDRVKMLISDCFADVKSTNALLLENGWPSGKWKPHNSGLIALGVG